ncbi:Arginine biosynthesis bifunctional protein ArgJ beta chain [Piedraia hortae CBS 480.64]|uniref:Arginine biosynthesis bifunctional protein ArgJ, mitochondrial n=1 Tax=Piedraia hortae CBS 480.64 TaxID=1314780 RepID=A0A6A7C3I0_9PEZI|nr:Arginine biosynthesis bifunctional protein ArgJ beta chain [Piedraia hortae CBS 480.64]
MGVLVRGATRIRSYSTQRSIPVAKQKYVPSSGSYPKGFIVGAAHAGVKPSNTEYDDVALIITRKPCHTAAVFTTNRFKAAPVTYSMKFLKNNESHIRGVVINSGCANAVTGDVGMKHAKEMAAEASKCFGDELPSTLVMSTGVIGQTLPIEKIVPAIAEAARALGSDHQHWMKTAQAICTTDTFPKLVSRSFRLPSDPETEYRIAGVTKGAGMIHPNMATLLGVICTDVKVEQKTLKKLLSLANAGSFNSISVDGEMSTNDTVALLANGAAAPEDVAAVNITSKTLDGDAKALLGVLSEVMQDLARLVVCDGEGATKLITIRVRTTRGMESAKSAASRIARSLLVKTALYGKDANWGRILSAIGAIDVPMQEVEEVVPHQTTVSFAPADGSAPLPLVTRGTPEQVDEARASEILEADKVEILVDLADGNVKGDTVECVFRTCDLSHEYISINADYRS